MYVKAGLIHVYIRRADNDERVALSTLQGVFHRHWKAFKTWRIAARRERERRRREDKDFAFGAMCIEAGRVLEGVHVTMHWSVCSEAMAAPRPIVPTDATISCRLRLLNGVVVVVDQRQLCVESEASSS